MKPDLLVIGAGIQGAAVAREAALRGYPVQLVEQYPEAARATSSRSSKLIHGGLRYLETGQFRLVRECLQARRELLRDLPELVKLVPFHIPVYQDSRRKAWYIRIGLMLYSLFSRLGFRSLPPGEWHDLDGLATDRLQQVFRYYDAQTDDAALTRRTLEEAQANGAKVHFDTGFSSARYQSGGWTVDLRQGHQLLSLHPRIIINATGPWVNQVLKRCTPEASRLACDWVLGSHILLPGRLQSGIYYLEAPSDQRAVFVMPWHDGILVGTTETPFHGDPAEVEPPPADIRYLLSVYNHYFETDFGVDDVIRAFAGLRVLPQGSGEGSGDAFSRPRDTRIHLDEQLPLISLYGGKLTSHRITARQVLDQVQKHYRY